MLDAMLGEGRSDHIPCLTRSQTSPILSARTIILYV